MCVTTGAMHFTPLTTGSDGAVRRAWSGVWRALVCALLGALFVACGSRALPDPTPSVDNMNSPRPPAANDVHPSGLTLLVEPQHLAPVVAIQVWVRVGSGDERDAEAGLAHVHEHMIFKGTEQRGVGQIARDIERLGGSINAWTSFDQTVYHVIVPSRHAQLGLDVLLDAVANSAFDADELERELEVIQEEIRQGEDQPGRVLSRATFETAFQTHPYGRPVIGTAESVAAFGREDVLAFFRRWYRPENMTLVVVGDIERDEVEAAVTRTFGSSRTGFEPAPARPVEPPQDGVRATVLQRDVQESHVNLAFRVPELGHADTPALELLTILLGQGESSLLFERVQRQARLSNDVYAYLYSPAEPGLLLLGARFGGAGESPGPEAVIDALLRTVAELHEQLVSADDLRRAIRNLESDAIYQRQTVQGTAQRLGYFHTVAGSVSFESRFVELARRVSPQDLRRVARTYLRPESCTAALLLPETAEAPDEALVASWVEAAYADVAQPIDDDALALDEGGVARIELPSGAVLLVQPDSSAPLVTMRAVVLGGSLAEDETTTGAGNLVAELLTSGTATRDASALAREVEGLAASLSGFSGRNTLGMRMTALSRDFDAASAIFFDALLHSEFPDDELARVRAEAQADLASQQDDIAGMTFRTFAETIYEGHPYARSVLGTPESIGGLDRSELLEYYRRLVQPSRMVVSVVGDVDVDHVVRVLSTRLEDTSAAAPRELEAGAPPTARDAAVRHEQLRERQQAHIVLGFPGVPMYDPRRPALDVLAAILGGQGGRLFVELRDRQSLAYSVSAFHSAGYDTGAFAFYIATSPEKIDDAIAGIRAEIDRLRSEPVSTEELDRARQFLIGRRDIGLQRQSARAAFLAFDELYGGGHAWGRGYASRIEAVDPEAIGDAVEAVFSPSREVLVLTRPPVDAESE